MRGQNLRIPRHHRHASVSIGFIVLRQLFTDDEHWRWRVRRAGDHLQIILPVITLGAILWRDNELLALFLMSLVLNSVLTHGLKYLIRRRRPLGGPRSFPSGHTATTMHCAAFMALQINLPLAIPLLLAAVFVGASRVIVRKHFTGDVIAGAILGIGTAMLAPWLYAMIF